MALLRKFDEGGTTQDTEQQTEQTITPPVAPPVTPPVVPPVAPQATQDIKPLTILVYGEDYDVNALTKLINAGIRPYLRTLRCKDKDKKFVEQAIYDLWDAMLEDISDGKRVTYNGTHFTDYKGILKNAPKDKKDFVGMAAWYVGNILDNATPVEKPKSYDYAPWLVGSVVLRRLFGTSAGDDVGAGSLQDWFLMDEPGEDNIRGTNNRADRFKQVLTEVLNDTHAFDEYNWSPENISRARSAIEEALKALENGLDPTDYSVFATNLGRFGTGAQGWNTLFMGDTRTPAELAEEKTKQEEEQKKQKEEADKWVLIPDPTIDNPDNSIKIPSFDGDGEKIFEAWMDEKHPDTKKSKEYTCSKNTGLAISANKDILNNLLNGYSSTLLGLAVAKELKGIKSNIGNKIRSNTRLDDNAICWALLLKLYKKSNKQDIGENFSYIPEILWDGEENGVLYNGKNGTLRIVSLRKIPSWMDERRKEFRKIAADLGISFWKQGGILTFKKGGEVGKYQNAPGPLVPLPDGGYEDVLELLKGNREPWFDAATGKTYSGRIQHIVDKKTNNINYQKRELNATNIKNSATAPYDYNYGGSQVEGQEWWKDWTDILTSNKDLAEEWARAYAGWSAKEGPTGNKYYKDWFKNGDYEGGEFDFDKFKNSSYLWSDAKNSIGHDIYRAMVYAIKGPNNKITYYSGPLEGFENDGELDTSHGLYDVQYLKRSAPVVPGLPSKSTTSTGTVNTRTGTGLGNVNNEEDDPSKVRKNYNQKDNSNKFISQFGILGDYPANIIGAQRLITHLRGNNQTADILSRYYRYTPLKKSPYYYAPVLGDLPAEQRAQREKGSLIYDAWRNLTSDASVNLANLLERYKLGMQKEDEGAEKNTARWRETAKEALGFAQKNIENNINTANENAKELVQTLQHLGEIKASNKEKNVTTVTNWLSEMQKNLHTRAEERIALTREANNMGAYMNYQDELQKLENGYLNDDGTMDYNRMYNDPKYINAVRDLKNKYQLELLQNAMRRGFRSSYTYFSKKGGKLIKRKRR